jgi:tetratricopeptide (TPR) repeat protein
VALNFAVATQLGLWGLQSNANPLPSHSILESLMGDSRRLFANHFITKEDIYLHGGLYPSIFDRAPTEERSHLLQAAADEPGDLHDDGHGGHAHAHENQAEPPEEDAASSFLGKPKDWLDGFGRNFVPVEHRHLEGADQKEVLPWLRLAAELNPNQVETYTLAAYWLRSRLGKVKDAEQFLREGWRANPNSFEIAFELGRLFEENEHDSFRARNLFELALRKWRESESAKPEPDNFSYMQITAHLARLEENEQHFDRAITYLRMLQKVSPHPEKVEGQVRELRSKQTNPLTARTNLP